MPLVTNTTYHAPYIMSNRHVATVVPNLLRFPYGVRYRRQRIDTPDGDFLDLDWSEKGRERLVIISHGLEGSARSPCVLGMVKYFNKRDWDVLAWNFRSCSEEVNRLKGFYFPGQTGDVEQVIEEALLAGYQEIYLVGFSLGGAYTLRYLGEKRGNLPPEVRRAAVFSTPIDLGATAKHLQEGASSYYARLFLMKYKRKMAIKEKRNPGTYDFSLWEQVENLPDFDRLFNSTWYGHNSVEEFYAACGSGHLLKDIAIPTLIVNAENDPFLPAACFPIVQANHNDNLFLEIPQMGGHIGFMTFSWKGIFWSESRAESFFLQP